VTQQSHLDISERVRSASQVFPKKLEARDLINQLRYSQLVQQRHCEKRGKRRGFIQIDNTIEHDGGNRDDWKAMNTLETMPYFFTRTWN